MFIPNGIFVVLEIINLKNNIYMLGEYVLDKIHLLSCKYGKVQERSGT